MKGDNRFSSTSSFGQKFNDTEYVIAELAKHDDVALLAPWKRKLHRMAPLFTLVALGGYYVYYAFRIYYTVEAQRAYGKTFPMAWVFIGAEFLVTVPTFFHQVYSLLGFRGRKRPQLRLEGQAAPTIDAFITCCKEDVDVVLDTARAACDNDYPTDRFRVIVLDDGADPELKKGMEDLSYQYPNAYYFARVKVKGQPHHAKAGNLIGGTDFVTKLPGGPGEFIAALDADMIPERDWLRALIPHLLRDPLMALACPPQLFYNVPDNDMLVQSLDPFVHVMEPIKDACGVAWCTGSGYIIRRSALDDIGGWPTGTLAEDTFTSSKLLGRGWKTAYVHEGLQFGTVPDTYTGHLKQRTRWTLGTLQSALQQRFCLYGDLVKKMTFYQRLSGCVFSIDAFFKVFLIISVLTIPIVLISGGQLVAYSTINDLRWQIRLAFICFALLRIQEYVNFLPSGYRLAQRDGGSMLWMAPYHARTVLQSFLLPKWLGGKPMAFTTSGSIKDSLNERDAANRAPVWRRLKVILWDCDAWVHLLYVMFVIAAVTLSIYHAFHDRHTVNGKLLYLVTHVGFPPMLWLVALTAFCIPIRYALFPPSMPDREELLDRDPKTGVAHPKEYWKKQRWGKNHFWHELEIFFLCAYAIFIFVISFIITDEAVENGS
ncbi:nucleotide-diphospho-sugar transferase [Delphinella strobiligena]|nr:nucleotide-diphospho-sugar transferase [Delphinella strobiligena]